MERFSKDSLHHVEPVVKQTLPDKQSEWVYRCDWGCTVHVQSCVTGDTVTCVTGDTVTCVTTAALEQERRSKFIQEIEAFDHSLLVTVETVVKETLPSADGETQCVWGEGGAHVISLSLL